MSKITNKKVDLHNILFAQLENLSDESLVGDDLRAEIERSKAICNVSGQILQNANLALKTAEFKIEYGIKDSDNLLPDFLEG